jgi:hypothetical protein
MTKELPPLALRTAYTQKGLGIGIGGFLGLLLGGPYAAMAAAYIGWKWGNEAAIQAEKNFLEGR